MPGKKKYSFGKDEKLTNLRVISNLFQDGTPIRSKHIKMLWRENTETNNKQAVQVLVTASKKTFRHAVTRNRIKRLLREVYRNNKIPLLEVLMKKDIQISIAFIYIGKSLPKYHELEKSFLECNKILLNQLVNKQ